MEPLTSAAGAIGVIRPSPTTSADAGNLLKDGRVVAAEVLETFDGGSVVLGIAGRRIPAQSHVELQPGQRFLATAETTDGEIVLRLAPGELGEGSRLVRALRLVVGQDSPTGAVLDTLASLVGTSASTSRALAALLGDLASHSFTPGADGEALRELVLRSGLRYESALLAAEVGGRDSVWLRVAVAGEIAARWVDAWRAAFPNAASDAELSSLRSTITSLLLEAVRELAGRAASTHDATDLAELAAWLRRVLDARVRSGSHASLRGVVEHAADELAARPSGAGTTALLRWLLGAAPDDGLRPLLNGVTKQALERDLKSRLLSVLSELEPGPAREVVDRALANLETDQLMNLARRRFDQAGHFSVPIPDAERWASAQFLQPPNREPDAHSDQDAHERAPQRLVIGIDFSRLGPIRADLLMREHDLIVRITVERPATADALRHVVESWRQDLAVGGRSVQVAVIDQLGVDVELNAVAPDVRFLAENHLMDVSG